MKPYLTALQIGVAVATAVQAAIQIRFLRRYSRYVKDVAPIATAGASNTTRRRVERVARQATMQSRRTWIIAVLSVPALLLISAVSAAGARSVVRTGSPDEFSAAPEPRTPVIVPALRQMDPAPCTWLERASVPSRFAAQVDQLLTEAGSSACPVGDATLLGAERWILTLSDGSAIVLQSGSAGALIPSEVATAIRPRLDEELASGRVSGELTCSAKRLRFLLDPQGRITGAIERTANSAAIISAEDLVAWLLDEGADGTQLDRADGRPSTSINGVVQGCEQIAEKTAELSTP